MRAVFSRDSGCIYSDLRFLVSPALLIIKEFFLEMLLGYNYLCEASSMYDPLNSSGRFSFLLRVNSSRSLGDVF